MTVPGLEARAEDVPLLLQHVLAEIAARDASLVARFRDPAGRFRLDAALAEAIVRHPFATHVRELEKIVWQAAAESPGDTLTAGPATRAALDAPSEADDPPDAPAADPGREALAAALAAAGGSVTAAARALGLKNRYVLYRLLKKHGLE